MDRSGSAGQNYVGNTVYALGRAIDPFIHYYVLRNGLAASALTKVGVFALPAATVTLGEPSLAGLGPVPTVLVSLYGVVALRHVYWITATNTGTMYPSGGIAVFIYNTFMNSISTLGAAYALSRAYAAAPPPTGPASLTTPVLALSWRQYAGAAIVAAGVLVEIAAEHSRSAFKADPKNKGRIDDTGLFGLVRHPNYMGYLMWRTGIALASGSGVALGVTFALQFFQFTKSIPGLARHMQSRYGAAWEEYEAKVPYRLIPYVY